MCDYCDCRLVPAIAHLTDDHDVLRGLTVALRDALTHDDTAGVAATVTALAAELAEHTDREERGIFAALRATDELAGSHVGRLEAEHTEIHARLRPGADARTLAAGLCALEAHIALEETDLFPRPPGARSVRLGRGRAGARRHPSPTTKEPTMTTTSSPSALDRTLGQLVAELPQLAPALDRLGLDYCCHGDRTVAEAAAAADLDVATVTTAVDAVLAVVQPAGGAGGPDTAWTALDLAELADHIESTHHAYLHGELADLDTLAAKVASVHGGRHPELAEVERVVAALRSELEPHLAKEERILFPAIRALVAGERAFPFGAVENPIRVMQQEHDGAGELLARLRSVTGGFAVPADGCASYHALYHRLEALELDTHLHVHKENHRLFPEAIALQTS